MSTAATSAPPETFGSCIVRLYKARGLNRNSFARLLGIAYTTALDWERRDALPSADRVAAIARCLSLSDAERQEMVASIMRVADSRRNGVHWSHARAVGRGADGAAPRGGHVDELRAHLDALRAHLALLEATAVATKRLISTTEQTLRDLEAC